MGGFAKRCNPKLAHVHVDKTNTALGVAAWKAGVRPIAAPAPLPEGEYGRPTAGRGGEMIARQRGRVCRLRAVRL
jgi:hypothetical protein